MRTSLTKILSTIISYALMLAVIFFVIGKYLDLRVESFSVDATRHSTNLLQLILTSSPIVKEKLILDSDKMDNYLSGSIKKEWEDSCELLEYDYNLSVYDLENKNEWKTGKLIFDSSSECYFDYQKIKTYSEMPVSIYYGDHTYDPGIANLILMRTPLSELAFWTSQASLRIRKGTDTEIIKDIRIGKEIDHIKFTKSSDITICMKIGDSEICKSFPYKSYPEIKICPGECILDQPCKKLEGSVKCNLPGNCNVITVSANPDEINITVPVS